MFFDVENDNLVLLATIVVGKPPSHDLPEEGFPLITPFLLPPVPRFEH